MPFKYIPELDGLRAVAILIVIASHFGAGSIIPGNFGVTLFFFISGFLITSLLEVEVIENRHISIRDFYTRRFLRLAPALVTMLALSSIGYFAVNGSVEWGQISAGLFYYTNYFSISGGSENMPFGPLWSLAVEEHFYLIYPFVIAFLYRDLKHFLLPVTAVTVIVLFWRCGLIIHWNASEAYTHLATDTRIDSILYGAILALLLRRDVSFLDKPAVFFASVVALLLTFAIRGEFFRETLRYSIQGLALIPIVFSCILSNRFTFFRKVLQARALVPIGKISYSLYLWHMPASYFCDRLIFLMPSSIVRTALALVVTFVAATISYLFIETPFQRLRRRFSHARLSNNYASYRLKDIDIHQPLDTIDRSESNKHLPDTTIDCKVPVLRQR
jgi:peptidoglycan/LPS O-acetylase OafA/YrhL